MSREEIEAAAYARGYADGNRDGISGRMNTKLLRKGYYEKLVRSINPKATTNDERR